MSSCWKRVALIIGHALAGNPMVPSLGEFSKTSGYPEFLVDALRPCEDVDKYLLRDNWIPQYIMHMISLGHVINKALVERYGEAIDEIKRIFETEKNREKAIHTEYESEKYYYLLGLAYIIADAARMGKDINNNDAAIALEAAAWALLGIRALTFDNVESILLLLGALRDKAPGKYLILLYNALRILMPELIRYPYPIATTVLDLIYESTNYVQEKYANELSGTDNITIAEIKATLARIAVEVLWLINIDDLNKAINLLNEAALTVWGYPPLYLRLRMYALKLKILRAGSISEYIDVAKNLEYLLSIAEKVISSIKDSLSKNPALLFTYYDTYYEALSVLGDYLIYLALVGDYPRIKELLDHYITLSNALGNAPAPYDRYRSMIILPRAMLITLLINKPNWDPDVTDKLLNYAKTELMGLLIAYYDSEDEYVPALKLLFGLYDREIAMRGCESFQGLKRSLCRTAILSVTGDEQATNYLKHYYMALIDKAPTDEVTKFINDLDGKTLVQLLHQLRRIEQGYVINRLLMFISSVLYSLINGDVKTFMSYIRNEILLRYFLFHCLCNVSYRERLRYELLNKLLFISGESPSTVLDEIYSSCCDINNEKFKLALLKLYYAIDVALESDYRWLNWLTESLTVITS
jgi:hypothetical protein